MTKTTTVSTQDRGLLDGRSSTPLRSQALHRKVALAKLAIAGLAALLVFLELNGYGHIWLSLTALTLLLFFPLLVHKWEEERDIFRCINVVVVVYFLAFWLLPLLTRFDFELAANPLSVSAGLREDDVKRSLTIGTLGLCAIYLGYHSRLARFLGRKCPVVFGPWRPVRMHAAIAISALLSIGVMTYFAILGGFSWQHMWLHESEFFVVAGTSNTLLKISLFTTVMLAFCSIVSRQNNRRRWRAFLIPFGVGFPVLFFGDRSILLTLLIPPIIAWHYHVLKFKLKRALLLLIAFYAFAFGIGFIRGGLGSAAFAGRATDLFVLDLRAQFSYAENLGVVLGHYPAVQDFYHGRIMAEDLLMVVPRAIWRGKPRIYGTNRVQADIMPFAADVYSGAGHYDAFSTMGLGYADFGYFGALLAAFILGSFCRVLDEAFGPAKQAKSALGTTLYGAAMVGTSMLLRGFVMHLLGFLIWFVTVLLIFKFVTHPHAYDRAPSHSKGQVELRAQALLLR